MPYIPQADRERAHDNPATTGELNFAFTMRMIAAHTAGSTPLALSLLKKDFHRLISFYWSLTSPNYQNINDILGAIAGALMEYRRRTQVTNFGSEEFKRRMLARAISVVVDDFYNQIATPYEREKIEENGDCY